MVVSWPATPGPCPDLNSNTDLRYSAHPPVAALGFSAKESFLKPRGLSSTEAFARSLKVHRQTAQRQWDKAEVGPKQPGEPMRTDCCSRDCPTPPTPVWSCRNRSPDWWSPSQWNARGSLRRAATPCLLVGPRSLPARSAVSYTPAGLPCRRRTSCLTELSADPPLSRDSRSSSSSCQPS